MSFLQRIRPRRPTRRQALLTGIAVVVLLLVVMLMRPDPVAVQLATVTTGPLQVIVEDEGETRVVDRYVVTAPVMAYAQRVRLEVGDIVEAGQPLVRLEPPRAAMLDTRSQTEATARVSAAQASLRQAEIAAQQAATEVRRLEELYEAGAVARQTVEQAAVQAARAAAARDAARAELTAAQAARATAAGTGAGTQQVADNIRAPAGGRVLAVHHESEGPVTPGQPLLEIGDTRQLQVQVDVLSQDAVRIAPGTRVLLEQWGGPNALEAVVTHVDPQGFTRVSALGVEERRVRILASLTSTPDEYPGLGAGYRVLARFIVWEEGDVLQVPTAALFRHDDGWATFVVQDGVARLRPVQVGVQAGLVTQVVSGVRAGETVIVHPGNEIEDGVRVG